MPDQDEQAQAMALARSMLRPIRAAAEALEGEDLEPACAAVDAASVGFPSTWETLEEITDHLWETRMACEAWRADPTPELATAVEEQIRALQGFAEALDESST
ncbi:MAG: hypothetical protein ACHQZR_04090 [Candidatus Limnocylindrales bacterium]